MSCNLRNEKIYNKLHEELKKIKKLYAKNLWLTRQYEKENNIIVEKKGSKK